MAVRKRTISRKIFLAGFIITLLLMVTVFFSNAIFSEFREDALDDRMDQMIRDYEEMQTLLFMADHFGEENSCVALRGMLSSMNKDLWDLGMKIDEYRQATEEFTESPFYNNQKRLFNQRSVLYYTALLRMDDVCDRDQTIASFYYKEASECPDCDSQAFVLTDIRLDLEELDRNDNLALFSFDTDLGLPSIDLLLEYYNITEFPCVVIGNEPYCGLKDRNEMNDILCQETNGTICF